jgi:hypothetical protein
LQKEIAMKTLYLLIIINLVLSLSGCTTTPPANHAQNAKKSTLAANEPKTNTLKEKDPLNVAMYTQGQKPANPYKVLGTESISKFNFGGIKRQTASIHDAMRDLAAKMGGDAVINIAHDDKTVTGTVITYQNNEQQKMAV